MTTTTASRDGFGRYALRCAWTALSLGLGLSPLVLLLTHLPGMSVGACVIALCGLAAGLAGALLPGRFRPLCIAAGVAVSAAIAVWRLLVSAQIAYAGLGAIGIACALLVPILRENGLPSTLAMGLAALHALMPLLARLAGVTLPLFLFASAYLVVFLINVNDQSLRAQCSSHQQRPAQSMRIGNRVLTVVLFGLCLIISQFDTLRRAFETLVQTVLLLIIRILSRLIPQPVESAGGGGGAGDMDFGGLAQGETALIWKILERVGVVITVIAVIALIIWLSGRIFKLLKAVWGHIRAFLNRYAQSLRTDYTDQTEDLSGWGEIGQSLRDKASGWAARLRPIHWDALDNRARVRAAYTAVLRREKKPDASRTARETLLSGASTGKSDAAQLCGSYERARYSDHPITDAEAENARRAL